MPAVTVGRIVHYHFPEGGDDHPSPPFAAIVVKAWGTEGHVNLQVFADGSGTFYLSDIEFSETPKADCWSWPVKV